MEKLYSKWIKVFPEGQIFFMTLSVNAFTRYCLQRVWIFISLLDSRSLSFYPLPGLFTALVMKRRTGCSKRTDCQCVSKNIVCHRVLGRTGTSVLARLPPCSLDLDLPCYCLAKLFHKGSAERDISYLVHNWIYNCHIQYINPNYLTLLCCSARMHLS